MGALVRDWRVRRRRSQMDLALDAGVSPRHLSFVETGRSRPSADLLLALAERLDVPLRERNVLLLAGGFAPRFVETSLDAAAMARVRGTLTQLLSSHDPYPGVVVDRLWNVVLANDAANLFTRDLPAELLAPPLNVFRLCLHPLGLARRTLNLAEWSAYLLGQLQRATALSGDAAFRALSAEIARYPGLDSERAARSAAAHVEPELLVPLRLALDEGELSLFTTMTTFGTPQDITLSELAVELFYPADERSERLLRKILPIR